MPQTTKPTGPRELGGWVGASRASAAGRRRGREGVKPAGGRGRGRGPRLRSAALHCLHGGEERRRAQPGTQRGCAAGRVGGGWSESTTQRARGFPSSAWPPSAAARPRPGGVRADVHGRGVLRLGTHPAPPTLLCLLPSGGRPPSAPPRARPPPPSLLPCGSPGFREPGGGLWRADPAPDCASLDLEGKHAFGLDRFKFLVWDPRPPASSASRIFFSFSFFFFFFSLLVSFLTPSSFMLAQPSPRC